MTARCSRSPTLPSYYVVMLDLGGRLGLAANVEPELTRSNVVDRIKSGEYANIAFIHFVEDGVPAENVTSELINEAEAELKVEAINKSERISYRHDHERNLRKHEVA
jgi:hypothetical protein